METAKNVLNQDLPRPVEQLADAQAEATLGGLPAIQKVRDSAARARTAMQIKLSDRMIFSY